MLNVRRDGEKNWNVAPSTVECQQLMIKTCLYESQYTKDLPWLEATLKKHFLRKWKNALLLFLNIATRISQFMKMSIFLFVYSNPTYTYPHIRTHLFIDEYIYIYIYSERATEKEAEGWAGSKVCDGHAGTLTLNRVSCLVQLYYLFLPHTWRSVDFFFPLSFYYQIGDKKCQVFLFSFSLPHIVICFVFFFVFFFPFHIVRSSFLAPFIPLRGV